jgi:hypothetical protein
MVDFALRRRFAFMDLDPQFESEAFAKHLGERGATSELVQRIRRRIGELNEAITRDCTNLGMGCRIGHSYFIPAKGETPDDTWYRRKVNFELRPLLREYWADDEKRFEEEMSRLLA